ncbi:MAG: hypothetical protein KF894_08940 [Labilithrix sp.]|nr:hypothetical protein [Labilithrix sp.]
MEPHLIDRFAAPDVGAEPDADEWNYARDVEPFLGRLSPGEADTVELFYRGGVSKRGIAKMLGISHPAVIHRLRSARARILQWKALPEVTVRQAREDLHGILSREDVKILVEVTYELAQAPVARRFEIPAQRLSERWARIRAAIERAQIEPYLTLVAAVPRGRKGADGSAQ